MLNIKQRYTELRFGATTLTPIFSYSNFILISYNFTHLNALIPLPLYVVLFTVVVAGGLTILGNIFRSRQLATDQELIFYQNKEMVKTLRITLAAIVKMDPTPEQETLDRLAFLKKIEVTTT